MNFAQLSAKLEPSYSRKMQHLQAKFQNDIALADYKAQQQAQLEYCKQENARQVERERHQTSREIEADKHKYRLEMLDAELSQHMRKMEGDRHFDKLMQLDVMENDVFSGAARNMDTRCLLRGEVFKQLTGALIQEKLAQKQHARDLEKVRLEHEQKKDSRLWDQLCAYIFALMENNQKQAAEEYIDNLVREWETAR